MNRDSELQDAINRLTGVLDKAEEINGKLGEGDPIIQEICIKTRVAAAIFSEVLNWQGSDVSTGKGGDILQSWVKRDADELESLFDRAKKVYDNNQLQESRLYRAICGRLQAIYSLQQGEKFAPHKEVNDLNQQHERREEGDGPEGKLGR